MTDPDEEREELGVATDVVTDERAPEQEEAALTAVAAPPAVDAAATRPGDRGGVLRDLRIAWSVAAIALLGLALLAYVALPAVSAERERATVQERAELVAARVTTFEGATIEEWVAQTRALATDDYAEQLDGVFDQELRDALRENAVESVGTIQRSFVQALEGDTAEVFILARQTSLNAQRPQPIEDELRIEITMRRVDGQWLAANVVVLGPQAPTVPTPPLPEED